MINGEGDYHTAKGGKRMAMTARRKSEFVRVIFEALKFAEYFCFVDARR
jgi:hypothetical protein